MLGLRAIFLPLLGGALIGISVSILLLFNGRVAGISGILGQALDAPNAMNTNDFWRWMFLAGLLVGGVLALLGGEFRGVDFFGDGTEIGWTRTVVAGLLVGFGTRLGSGCTSGHGVCGIGRLSFRSFIATLIFVLSGVATVALA